MTEERRCKKRRKVGMLTNSRIIFRDEESDSELVCLSKAT